MPWSWFSLLGIPVLAGVVLAGCAPRVEQQVAEARAAVAAARAAGAEKRSAEQFQTAERTLKESEALLAAGDAASLGEAGYRAALAAALARSALTTTTLAGDLEQVRTEARAARQEAERARAEAERLQPQVRTAEEAARTAQARAERVEAQVTDLQRQFAVTAAPASPLAAYARYVVKKGDTLAKIAARPEIYGDASQWGRIYDANRDSIGRNHKLTIGQVLLIPKP
jgi:nucleoid-associated protein YgaU